LTSLLRTALDRTRRGRLVLTSSVVVGLLAAPLALGATGQGPIGGGTRNPSSNTSSGYSNETQIIGSVAQNQGGLAANTPPALRPRHDQDGGQAPFATNGTGMVANLNADKVGGKNADVAKGSLLFAVVAADGAIGANRGVPANAKATVGAAGSDPTFTVPMPSDVSGCAYTASPTAATTGGPLVVAPGGDKATVVVTEHRATTPVGFHLQVTC
jgi:hypothetical protein